MTENNNSSARYWTAPWPTAVDENGYLYTVGQGGYEPTRETVLHYEPENTSRYWSEHDHTRFPIDSIRTTYPAGTRLYRCSDGTFYILETPQLDSALLQEILNSQVNESRGSSKKSDGGLESGSELGSGSGSASEENLSSSNPSSVNIVDIDGNLLFHTKDPIQINEEKLPSSAQYYEHMPEATLIVNPEFSKVRKAYADTFARTANEGNNWVPLCLATTANWDVNHTALYIKNYTPFRLIAENVPLELYDIDGDKSTSSWEEPYRLEASGNGKLIYFAPGETVDITKFPIGTIFYNGYRDGNHYIEDKTKEKDEKGNVRPSHTYSYSGLSIDNEGTVTPLIFDYGALSNNVNSRIYDSTPIYAFVRNGSEDLTAEKLIPKYKEYLSELSNVNLDNVKLKNNDSVNEEISKIDPTLIYRIAKKFNVPMEEAFRRLMAIGLQESELGSSAGYKTKSSAESVGDWTAQAAKAVKSVFESADHTFDSYDTIPAWKHEVLIYDALKNSGALENKTDDEIRTMVADLFNKEKAAAEENGIDYGVLDAPTNYDVSHGWFLMKPDAYTDDIYNGLRGNTTTEEDKISRAYNRFAYLYSELAKKYPNLTLDLLLNAATVAWNAQSKANDQNFIDHYITSDVLRDVYLDKVLGFQKSLYKKGGGIHLNPKNKGKFTETKKRTGKTTEELTHSKNPLTRKRAIFALNAAKWSHKHLFGGNFLGIATDNGIMVSKDKQVSKSKPKIKLVKKKKK